MSRDSHLNQAVEVKEMVQKMAKLRMSPVFRGYCVKLHIVSSDVFISHTLVEALRHNLSMTQVWSEWGGKESHCTPLVYSFTGAEKI